MNQIAYAVSPLPLLFFDEKRFLADLATGSPIEIFRNAINAANIHFDTRFEQGEQIRTLINERSAFMDRILGHAWSRFQWDRGIALVAVGGYGRNELHPHSDIDLLILTRHTDHSSYRHSIEALLTFLWDIQLNIGHSVRSLQHCVEECASDVTVATTLMESRTIAGETRLRKLMEEQTGPDRIWPSHRFFRAKWNEQIARHNRHGNTEYNLEPNIKEAPGGLRDIQTISWIAKRHFRTHTLEALVDKGFLTRADYHQLMRGEEFLWRVRYGLHLLARRAEERLLFDYQRKLAVQFGYRDNEERLAVEQFMQRYYRVVLNMRELNDVLLQYLDEMILRKNQAKTIRPINARFQVRDDHIEAIHALVFEETPSALLEIFVLLGEDDSIQGIRSTTIRELVRNRNRIDDDFRAAAGNKALFLRLLECPGKLSPQLQRMTRYGILGRYLPEFGRIVGQMQHDLFHVYPVDAHTIQIIRNIRRLANQEEAEKFPVACHVCKNLPKPELLVIAGLYHDIGKGRRGNHSALGAIDVVDFAQRHGLTAQETRLLKWLVENHLLMSSVSQREDISDPDVIHKFARLVDDQIHLDYLFTLTVADINATNPKLWTNWKGSLLRQLYFATRDALDRGLENPVSKEAWIEDTRNEALALLAARNIPSSASGAVWGDIGREFFLHENAAVIARCTQAVHAAGSSPKPVIVIEDAGVETTTATRIFIHTKGLNNVFPITAATLDNQRLNIQDARLHSASNGHTFDIFYVLNEHGDPFGKNHLRVRQVKEALSQALQFPSSTTFRVQRRTPRQLKQLTIGTSVYLSNDIATHLTLIQLVTPDRPGLLAQIGRIFMRFGLRLHSAKIATLGERVEDVFHVTDTDYQPLFDPLFCQQLMDTIRAELDTRNLGETSGQTLPQAKLWD
ncbi:MAG: [protein-PII] uridylyltransferase [Porticoccaceae bacterium]